MYFGHIRTPNPSTSGQVTIAIAGHYAVALTIDLYETNLTESMILEFALHIKRMSSRIVKLAIAGDKKCIKPIYKALLKDSVLNKGQIYVCSDMEEGKTWLVSDSM